MSDQVEQSSQYSDHLYVRDSTNNSWANLFTSIPEGSRVLDVGCSSGNFGDALQQLKGCEVVGVDINAADIEVAKTKLADARVVDIGSEPDLSWLGTFDIIVFADVLEHMPSPYDTLVRTTELLREGGKALYSIPNMAHLSVRLDLLGGRFPYTEIGILDQTHLHFYDRREVENLFTSAGYVITEQNPVISEYPRSMIEGRLAELGLSADEGFFRMLGETSSTVFQFVGTAVPSGVAPTGAVPYRDRQLSIDEINQFALAMQARVIDLDGAVAREHERGDAGAAQVAALSAELTVEKARADDLEQQVFAARDRWAAVKAHPVRAVVGRLTSRGGR